MFTRIKKIPTPEEILVRVPLPEHLKKLKSQRDAEVKAVLDGTDDRFLLVIGPCSADHIDPVCDYVARLAAVAEKVKDKILIVPRIYTNKPRTKGTGYKGIFTQPDPNADPDIEQGIVAIRTMHIRAMAESHLTGADEMLYPENFAYVDDLLSYVTIGARSSENQQHRLVASGVDVPVGIKNPMSGNMPVLLNSIYAAQQSHVFKYHDYQVKTGGNAYAHAVLRGAVDLDGKSVPNYHFEDLMTFRQIYEQAHLSNPAVVIDTNHSNSNKKYLEQMRIARSVMSSIRYDAGLKKYIKGLMVESYLEPGCQDIYGKVYGQSITDACLGWKDTEEMIYRIADRL